MEERENSSLRNISVNYRFSLVLIHIFKSIELLINYFVS